MKEFKVGDWVNTSGRIERDLGNGQVVVRIEGNLIVLSTNVVWNPDKRADKSSSR